MMGVFDFFGTIASGWLSDRYDNRALLFWYYGLRGLSLLYLPFSAFSFYGLSLFGAFYGLDWIATVPPTVWASAHALSARKRAGVAFGWIFAAHQLGAATAAFGAGLSRSLLASYLPAFFAAGAMCLVASGIVWLIRKHPGGAGGVSVEMRPSPLAGYGIHRSDLRCAIAYPLSMSANRRHPSAMVLGPGGL